jgi:mRNA interferase MazF
MGKRTKLDLEWKEEKYVGITSTIRSIPSEVVLDEKDSMKNRCAVNLDHIQTVSKSRIGAFITKLTTSKIHQINRAIVFALEI